MRGLTTNQFWGRVEAMKRVAALRGARFPDDTPQKRARRRAEGLLYPERFNAMYLGHYFREGAADFHIAIYRAMLQRDRLCVRAPRGHAKSTILTFAWPVHQVACAAELRALAEGRLAELDSLLAAEVAQLRAEDPSTPVPPWEPYIQVIAVKDDLATEFTAAIQVELCQNDLIRSDWPGVQDADENDAEGDFVINGVRIKAFGMTSGIRGGKHGPYRPSRAIIDDPDDKRTVATPRSRDGQESTLSAEVEFGLEPTGAITVVGTSVHADCLVRRLEDKERYPEWEVLVFRAFKDDGTPLWPERWPAEKLHQIQDARPEFFAQEMDDSPIVEGGRPFHTLHRYSRIAWRDAPLGKVLAFDPALGRTDKSDFQAVGVLRGPTPQGRVLLHRCELLRIGDPLELVRRINLIVQEEHPDLCVIESIGFQVLLKVLLDQAARALALLVGWVEIRRQQDSKDLRIRGTAPIVNDGILEFPDDRSCLQGERQYLEYPSGKKDFPDVVEMALREMRTPSPSLRDIRHIPGRGAELASFGGRRHEAWDPEAINQRIRDARGGF